MLGHAISRGQAMNSLVTRDECAMGSVVLRKLIPYVVSFFLTPPHSSVIWSILSVCDWHRSL